MSKPTVISLFSGIGGIDLGLIQSGFEIVFANEKEKYACVTYRNNFPGCSLVEGDICNLRSENPPKADIIAAGFPCQPFSVMGMQRGFRDPRGNMFFEIARLAANIKPKVILLENVKNLIYHDNGKRS